jgi:hypothetical protein
MLFNLMDLEIVRNLIEPKILLILGLILEAVLLLGLVIEIPEWRSCLRVAATAHAHSRCVILILRGPAEWFLKVGHGIASIIHGVILVFVGWQLFIRNFLLIFHLFKRLLGEASLLLIILLVDLLRALLLLSILLLLAVAQLIIVELLLVLCLLVLWVLLGQLIRGHGRRLIVNELTMIVLELIAILVVDRLHVILPLLLSILMVRHRLVLFISLEVIVGALMVIGWVIRLLLERCLLGQFVGVLRLHKVFLTPVFRLLYIWGRLQVWLLLCPAGYNLVDSDSGRNGRNATKNDKMLIK